LIGRNYGLTLGLIVSMLKSGEGWFWYQCGRLAFARQSVTSYIQIPMTFSGRKSVPDFALHWTVLRPMAAVIAAGLLCTSCGRGLPSEPVFILARSTTPDSPNGRVYTSLGGKTSMRAGDPEIGLLHILILPPADHELVHSTATLDEGAPEILRFEWQFSNGTTANLAISHDPQTHVVSVAGQHFPLAKGNLFVAQPNDKGALEFHQLSRTLFECVEARKALAAFKRELPSNERVQKIQE
jgi:hypothetical protein